MGSVQNENDSESSSAHFWGDAVNLEYGATPSNDGPLSGSWRIK
jgi:hypothetical protein